MKAKGRRRTKPKTIEPLGGKSLRGMLQVAIRYLGNRGDAEEVVQDVHLRYLRGEVAKDLLLRATKLRAIDRWRSLQAQIEAEARAEGEEHGTASFRNRDTGAVETVIIDPRSTGGGDPEVEILAGLMVEGQYRQTQYRGVTMGNPRRNEDRIIARLDAQRARQKLRAKERGAIEKLSGDPGRGRPSQKDRDAAASGLARIGVTDEPRRVLRPVHKPAQKQAK